MTEEIEAWFNLVDEAVADPESLPGPVPLEDLVYWVRNEGALEESYALALLDEIQSLRAERDKLRSALERHVCEHVGCSPIELYAGCHARAVLEGKV